MVCVLCHAFEGARTLQSARKVVKTLQKLVLRETIIPQLRLITLSLESKFVKIVPEQLRRLDLPAHE